MTAALTAAAIPGAHIILHADLKGAACILNGSISIAPGMTLTGEGSPTLKLTGAGSAFAGNRTSTGFAIAHLTIDGSGASGSSAIRLDGSHDGSVDAVTLLNPANGLVLVNSAYGIVVKNLTVTGSRAHGITIKDSHGNSVDGARLDGQPGFGIILSGNSHSNRLTRIQTTRSGLELVGMTAGTHENILTDSIAQRTGDNCYSITGSRNTLQNLSGVDCAGNGIAFYGSYNTLHGGVFKNNNQQFYRRDSWNGGVAFIQGFGGVAQHNTVSGVILDDDQERRTQQIGVLVQRAGYPEWRPGMQVKAGAYVAAGLRLYRAREAGTTGGREPAGTAPIFDNGVHWDYARDFDKTTQPDFNHAAVSVGRSAKTPREDRSAARENIGTR